ncbi:MAG TPA: NfeD family protein [Blastocatellia bacterium]|nr:NfeD family protein [Blastocatellia bacterium]
MFKILLMLKVASRARRAKRDVGLTGIVGLRGRAVTTVAPEGTVFVRNELWRARAAEAIGQGESVLVTGLDGITLEVEAKATPGNKSEKQLK